MAIQRNKTRPVAIGNIIVGDFNPIAVQTVPYATLGAGFSILRDFQPVFTFTVLNATDTTTTSGLSELFADGVALSAELRLPTHLLGRPGHQGIGATWNSKEYTALGQDPRVIFPGIPIRPKVKSTLGSSAPE